MLNRRSIIKCAGFFGLSWYLPLKGEQPQKDPNFHWKIINRAMPYSPVQSLHLERKNTDEELISVFIDEKDMSRESFNRFFHIGGEVILMKDNKIVTDCWGKFNLVNSEFDILLVNTKNERERYPIRVPAKIIFIRRRNIHYACRSMLKKCTKT